MARRFICIGIPYTAKQTDGDTAKDLARVLCRDTAKLEYNKIEEKR